MMVIEHWWLQMDHLYFLLPYLSLIPSRSILKERQHISSGTGGLSFIQREVNKVAATQQTKYRLVLLWLTSKFHCYQQTWDQYSISRGHLKTESLLARCHPSIQTTATDLPQTSGATWAFLITHKGTGQKRSLIISLSTRWRIQWHQNWCYKAGTKSFKLSLDV